jgi:ribosomal protein S18 acetylase RimI-like enzyme
VLKYDMQGILAHADHYEREVRDGRVIACVDRHRVQWYQWEVCHLSVDARFEGQHIASAVYDKAERFARESGARIIQCTIRADNAASERFFTHKGFVKTVKFLNRESDNEVGVWQKVL